MTDIIDLAEHQSLPTKQVAIKSLLGGNSQIVDVKPGDTAASVLSKLGLKHQDYLLFDQLNDRAFRGSDELFWSTESGRSFHLNPIIDAGEFGALN